MAKKDAKNLISDTNSRLFKRILKCCLGEVVYLKFFSSLLSRIQIYINLKEHLTNDKLSNDT
jgi:hypothetical protein